ncbi:MAG: molybdate ABC transporter substrate-binding protein [Hahellaceae bacterium]|nr:molybdate ABC transporter substrate-binding protein [Hahellaceae bacterium]MCP5213111.1 molybdate ABC transporter substrate-binding protein [Hahellaceae bacterium]
MRALPLVFLLLISVGSPVSIAEEIILAVASNFMKPMQYLAQEFEKTTEHKVRLAFGSSGKLYAQIIHGAPYHAFFSADQTKIDALAKDGLIVQSSRFTYAVGQLALWSSNLNGSINAVEQLKTGNFTKMTLANPKLAPYGAAAVQVLENLHLRESTASKWVLGENIAQTYQFVYSQNAELGFVALSQLAAGNALNNTTAWLIPVELYEPIKQDAALLASGRNNAAANAFIKYMQENHTQAVITSFGYKMQHNQEP